MPQDPFRRRILKQTGVSITIGLSGCLGTNPRSDEPKTTVSPRTIQSPSTETSTATKSRTPSPTPTPTCDETFDATNYVSDWHPEKVRGAAEPIAVEATIDSDAAIEIKCGRAARDAVQEVTKERLEDTSGLAWGFGKGGDTQYQYIVTVTRILTVSRECDVKYKPAMSFESVRQAAPQSVQATVHYEDTTYSCDEPVFVSDEVLFEL